MVVNVFEHHLVCPDLHLCLRPAILVINFTAHSVFNPALPIYFVNKIFFFYFEDHSRDNSPLHDVVLQSAPGSPRGSYQNHRDSHSVHSVLQDIDLQSAPSSPSSSNVHSFIDSQHNVLQDVVIQSNSSPIGYRDDQKIIIDSVAQSRAPIPSWRPNYEPNTG